MADMTSCMMELVKASGEGVSRLSEALSQACGYPILVIAPSGNVISSSRHYLGVDSVGMVKKALVSQDSTDFMCTVLFGKSAINGLGWPIPASGKRLGYGIILYGESPFDYESMSSIVSIAKPLYAIHLKNIADMQSEQFRMRDAFLYDLLYGNLKNDEEIATIGDSCGWDFRNPQMVCVWSVEIPSEKNPKHRTTESAAKLHAALESILPVRWNPAIATSLFRTTEVTILPAGGMTKAQRLARLTELRNEVARIVESPVEEQRRVFCAAGKTSARPCDLFRSFQEAKVALEVARLQGSEVLLFDNIGLERILYKHDVEDLREYYEQVLGPLLSLGEEGQDLLTVLECLADNDFNVSNTAAASFLHRNTLRYKLNKIETLLDCSLNDTGVRLDIAAALKIKRLHLLDSAE